MHRYSVLQNTSMIFCGIWFYFSNCYPFLKLKKRRFLPLFKTQKEEIIFFLTLARIDRGLGCLFKKFVVWQWVWQAQEVRECDRAQMDQVSVHVHAHVCTCVCYVCIMERTIGVQMEKSQGHWGCWSFIGPVWSRLDLWTPTPELLHTLNNESQNPLKL